MSASWQIPDKLAFLFQPCRYKIARGGRGSAKSWSVARALLIQGYMRPTRVLCTREVQKSIKQSVYQLLKDQVTSLGLDDEYQVLATEIRGRNGSEFYFSGLSDLTVDSIKSFEGVDVVWVEEGQTITKRSWDILIPTIRKPGSEIWVTYNPELETDETHKRFTLNPPPDCKNVLINHSDNPWFPEVLEQERLHALATLPEAEYLHIWEGRTLPAVAGAIYFNEVAEAEAAGRVGLFPHDPRLKVHTVWDMGWNDAMAVALVQRQGAAVSIVGYLTGRFRKTTDFIGELQQSPQFRGWNWGHDWLPHDAFAHHRQTGRCDADDFRSLGRSVREVPKVDREAGIRQARMVFPRVYFNRPALDSADPEAPGLLECLKRYRRRISPMTGQGGEPLHDEYSNGADCFRYLALSAEHMDNEEMGTLQYPSLGII